MASGLLKSVLVGSAVGVVGAYAIKASCDAFVQRSRQMKNERQTRCLSEMYHELLKSHCPSPPLNRPKFELTSCESLVRDLALVQATILVHGNALPDDHVATFVRRYDNVVHSNRLERFENIWSSVQTIGVDKRQTLD